MLRKPILHAFATLACLGAFSPALAQAPLEEPEFGLDGEPIEEVEIRRYSVEVIIFKYAQDVSTGSEIFIPDPVAEEPLEEELVFEEELAALEEPELEPEEEPEPLPDPEVVLLSEEEYQLGEVLEQLERLDVYEPVMHFGWTQATWPEEETEAIPLVLFAEPPEDLDGTLMLYLSRYLHLVVDLQLAAPPEVVTENQDDSDYRMENSSEGELLGYYDSASAGEQLGYADEIQESQTVFYRIQENRILRNGELRYFDHPKFGVLAMVTRIEEEEEDPDDETGELLGYGPE